VARKTLRTVPTATGAAAWPALLGIGAACAALGSGGTYMALRPVLARAFTARVEAARPTPAPGITAQERRILGNWYEDHGQWPQAADAYTQAIAGGLDNPDIRTDLGVAYFKSSQPQKALDQYVQAQAKDPNHQNSLFNEGSAYAVLGDGARAVAIWKQYLQRFPKGQHVADARRFITAVQTQGLKPVPPKPVPPKPVPPKPVPPKPVPPKQ